MRYPSLEHHCTAAGVFGSSGKSKADRNDWALVLRIKCAAREPTVADLSKDNSSFGTVLFLGRIIRVFLTLASDIVALICRRGSIEARFLATLVATLKLRASQVQVASSLAFSALAIQPCARSCAISGQASPGANREQSSLGCSVHCCPWIECETSSPGLERAFHSKDRQFFLGALVFADRDKAGTPGKAEAL